MDIYTNKYNVGATVEGVTLITRGALDFKSTPTLAVGDVLISKDGGTFTNIASLPAVTPAANTSVQVVLSATEMSAKEIIVRFIDQTGPKEWEDYVFKLRTYGHASAFYPGDLDNLDGAISTIINKLPTNYIMGSSVVTNKDDEIDAIKTSTDAMFGKLPTNYIMGSTVVTAKDDEIDAIKVKTDQLLFDSYGDIKATLNYLAGTVVSDPTNGASQFVTNFTSAVNDFHVGSWLLITSGILETTAPRKVIKYNGSTKSISLNTPYTSTPVAGVTFKLFVE